VWQNKVLRRISVPREKEEKQDGEKYITRSFIICRPILPHHGR
jgi:hypothetical protein